MTVTRKMILAGIGGALLGSAALFAVMNLTAHRMTVALPGGGTAEIRYEGAAPKVAIYPNALNQAIRPASFMMRDGAAARIPARAILPANRLGCARELRIVIADGQAPQVMTRESGNCAVPVTSEDPRI